MGKLFAGIIFAVAVVNHLNSRSYGAIDGGDTLSLGTSLIANQTIVSKNGTFELGFFSPNGSNWYIGIWYAKIPKKTYVWVANRETPARNGPGVLTLSSEGNLVLFNAQGVSIWSVNTTNKPSRAVLLDSGNFVIHANENKSETVWQSFENPTDTWLPGMVFGGHHQKLVSWKSSMDPAPGLFSWSMDPSGVQQFVLTWNNSIVYWETGIWDGKIFSGVPESGLKGTLKFSVENSSSGLFQTYTLLNPFNALVLFVLTQFGEAQNYFSEGGNWSLHWSAPRDGCAVYGTCGAYGICDSRNLQLCTCVEGFKPTDNRAWQSQDWATSGCVRKSPLTCNSTNGRRTDRFIELGVTLPEDFSSSYPASTKKDCQEACFRNCSCTAFTFNPPSSLCKFWFRDLLGMRNSSASNSNSNAFIRVAASPQVSKKQKASRIVGLVVGVVGAVTAVLGISSIVIWRRHRRRSMARHEDSSDSFLRLFTYKELKTATGNFSSEVGSGGFGSVFKGCLPDGTIVAVKEMKSSIEDEKQFRAEISSLGNIQHANLVRLRGFCVEGSRRLLIYDYMTNGSLNSFLFTNKSKDKHKQLDWKTRFQIALGTARGLVYLHEECRDCIIHCDVKPENILLDENMSPKLADFGMSKLVGRNFSRVLTTIRGTRGYLAPEWISGLPITPKVDVYSFGVSLLEIISGRRNLEFSEEDSSKVYFPPWATAQIYQGNIINIVEESIAKEANMEDVRRACIVVLLCIQEDEEVRPTMREVVQMLEGNMELQTPRIHKSVVMPEHRIDTSNSSDVSDIS